MEPITADFGPPPLGGLNRSHRKEAKNGFGLQMSALGINGDGEIVELVCARWYYTAARVYCCVWIHEWHCVGGANRPGRSGSGYAGGGGYCRESAVREAMLAVASAMGFAGAQIHRANP